MSTLDQHQDEQSKTAYRPVAMRYGLIAALVIIGLGLIFNVAGLIDYTDNSNPGNIASQVLTWGVIITAMVLAVKTHRDEDLGGYITFGRAYGVVFLTGLIIAVISLIWSYLFMQFIDPGILETVADSTRESMLERGMSESEVEEAWGMTSMFISAPAIAGFAFIFTLVGVALIGLIVAAVMQRKP